MIPHTVDGVNAPLHPGQILEPLLQVMGIKVHNYTGSIHVMHIAKYKKKLFLSLLYCFVNISKQPKAICPFEATNTEIATLVSIHVLYRTAKHHFI